MSSRFFTKLFSNRNGWADNGSDVADAIARYSRSGTLNKVTFDDLLSPIIPNRQTLNTYYSGLREGTDGIADNLRMVLREVYGDSPELAMMHKHRVGRAISAAEKPLMTRAAQRGSRMAELPFIGNPALVKHQDEILMKQGPEALADLFTQQHKPTAIKGLLGISALGAGGAGGYHYLQNRPELTRTQKVKNMFGGNERRPLIYNPL